MQHFLNASGPSAALRGAHDRYYRRTKARCFFLAGKCFVDLPGIVDKILETVNPIAEYQRFGNLYIAEVTWGGFHKQGQAD